MIVESFFILSIGCSEKSNSKSQKRKNQFCKCAAKGVNKLDHDLELKSLISHRQPKVRIRSYSQDLSFPPLNDDINKEEKIDVVFGQNQELKRLQGLSAVKTVVINL